MEPDTFVENSLPIDNATNDINLNTYSNPSDISSTTNDQADTTPSIFDHAQRLADKVQGAVIFNIDKAVDEATRDKSLAQPAPNQIQFIPSSVSTWMDQRRAYVYAAFFGLILFIVFGTLARSR